MASVVQAVDDLAFAKQFLISPHSYQALAISHWRSFTIDAENVLRAHPSLQVASAGFKNICVLGLGIFLDPLNPRATNDRILDGLAASIDSFSQLEDKIAILSGRWVIIAAINGDVRVYSDATGQKPVFLYCKKPFFAASQPALLEQLGITERKDKLFEKFLGQTNSGSWPVSVVPYGHVTQVLPNHYLDLNNGTIVRYWPKHEITERSVEGSAAEMSLLLRGTIAAARNRRRCVMNLTGGYDSRVLLAASKKFWNEIEFFTTIRNDSANHDISIPKKLRKELKIRHHFIHVDETETHRQLDRLKQNVGDMYYDPAILETQATIQMVRDNLHLTGHVSEVNRCYYYKNNSYYSTITPEELAARAGFAGQHDSGGRFQFMVGEPAFASTREFTRFGVLGTPLGGLVRNRANFSRGHC